MVSYQMLLIIDQRLRQITSKDEYFGGINECLANFSKKNDQVAEHNQKVLDIDWPHRRVRRCEEHTTP